jgi:Tfp pilus assembly protein PilE
MTKNPLKSSAGFTYIAAIVMVVIAGIMLSQAAQYWTTRMQREREAELLFRGTQVRDAMRRWYNFKAPVTGATSVATVQQQAASTVQQQTVSARPNLSELKTLLNGNDSAAKTHFLRPSNLKVKDPLTGKEMEWSLYKAAGTEKVTGVYIKSEGQPLKQDNFPFDLPPDDFKGKKKYSDWVFIYDRVPPVAGAGGVTGLGGSASPTGATGLGSPTAGSTGANPGTNPETTRSTP